MLIGLVVIVMCLISWLPRGNFDFSWAKKGVKMFRLYSQNDPKWKYLTLGNSDTTIGKSGCFIVSLAMLYGKDPQIVNETLKEKGCFTKDGLLLSDQAAKALGMTYDGVTHTDPRRLCIAETDYYKGRGIPQHFFLWLGLGDIVDPIDGKQKPNKYPVVSFRLFEKNGQA